MSKINHYQIPFDEDGNMLSYVEGWQKPIWKDNIEWEDELQYEGYGRGRSAVQLFFRSTITHIYYLMFVSDLNNIINLMIYGKIKGNFIGCKKGMNYGIRLIKEDKK